MAFTSFKEVKDAISNSVNVILEKPVIKDIRERSYAVKWAGRGAFGAQNKIYSSLDDNAKEFLTCFSNLDAVGAENAVREYTKTLSEAILSLSKRKRGNSTISMDSLASSQTSASEQLETFMSEMSDQDREVFETLLAKREAELISQYAAKLPKFEFLVASTGKTLRVLSEAGLATLGLTAYAAPIAFDRTLGFAAGACVDTVCVALGVGAVIAAVAYEGGKYMGDKTLKVGAALGNKSGQALSYSTSGLMTAAIVIVDIATVVTVTSATFTLGLPSYLAYKALIQPFAVALDKVSEHRNPAKQNLSESDIKEVRTFVQKLDAIVEKGLEYTQKAVKNYDAAMVKMHKASRHKISSDDLKGAAVGTFEAIKNKSKDVAGKVKDTFTKDKGPRNH